jgi:hypothetical protein
VKRNKEQYQLPLKVLLLRRLSLLQETRSAAAAAVVCRPPISSPCAVRSCGCVVCVVRVQILSYRDLYGWSMDDIVRVIGLRNNCTCHVCRVCRAIDRG